MAVPIVEELISIKPFLGPNTKDRYYVGVEGRTVGNDFLPADGRTSSVIVLYKRINQQDYNKIRQRGDDKLVTTYNLDNGEVLYLGVNAILNGNKLATTTITSPEIKQDPAKWGTIIKGQANETIEEYKLENKSNISPGTAKITETIGNASVLATPVVGTGNIGRKVSPLLVYPSDMKDGQDRIKFSVWKNKTRNITSPNVTTVGDNLNLADIYKSQLTASEYDNYELVPDSSVVYLPITKISDSNTVDWNEDLMNPLQRRLAEISLNLMVNEGQKAINQTNELLDYATKTPEFANMVRLSLAGQAVGVGGLLTRATGAIFNPNLELLFRGPQLRSFVFNFSMIPKAELEAKKIKQIIKFFKKNMAVRNTESKVFLQSPYVFKVEYLSGTKEHRSLNKIKLCALQSCAVDYTPMGSYMTFDDEDKTMFMYNLGLQFKELTPIYDNDYDNEHSIGY
ncbi:hypothetical protein b3_0003 [Synechococcus phage B3]|nr:hypothetical protein b3_0003 [Synechococcus phage B3]QGT54631.1 hypothetical protein b23_0003 [Synechococcus phage B23]